mmetsp:Transcript_6148/g.9877  ORF Transcript_6148/g.9877 Transcript_6148/m.9877 type:complete len:254 (+) Transcript_6148:84-845(+)|eukprot:CAMPEP_0170481692 /NCGR_PEP_ID=MMETSP0208-20121228/2042_1 /TAXON_ID=197538 /ORGANISM="Strombidium inclinatum, Strain S3" /LENGTH=253 /DNA_ID=CAMNT_0010754443 /DNA_START=84 /DNA_END=845 /DNA_ORIENTATION=-
MQLNEPLLLEADLQENPRQSRASAGAPAKKEKFVAAGTKLRYRQEMEMLKQLESSDHHSKTDQLSTAINLDQLKKLKKLLAHNIKYFNHDEIISRTGGPWGRFQLIVLFACLISFSTEGFLIYNLAYLNLPPPYYCIDGSGFVNSCEMGDTCENIYNHDFTDVAKNMTVPPHTTNGYFMDQNNGLFLHNWIEEFDLRCSERWEIGLFGSIFFVGHVIGSIILSGLGDTVGRIPLMRVGQGATLISYIYIVYLA